MLTVESIEVLANGLRKLTFIPCPECGRRHYLTVRLDEYMDWLGGKTAAEAFPTMLDPDRELFITAIDGECWKEIFAKSEEEEDEEDAIPPAL